MISIMNQMFALIRVEIHNILDFSIIISHVKWITYFKILLIFKKYFNTTTLMA